MKCLMLLAPTSAATTVRVREGQLMVTDAPFADFER